MTRYSPLLFCLLLSFCATDQVSRTCPDIHQYTPQEETTQGNALANLYANDPNNPLIPLILEDDRLRQAAKGCQSEL